MQTICTVPHHPFGSILSLTRIERDQLVIFDPRCAPLLRPLLRSADLQAWHTPAGAHWLIVAPAGQVPPRLAQHLAAVAPPEAPEGWWAVDPPPLPPPRIIIRNGEKSIVSWDTSNVVIGAPAVVITQAEPFLLALLGSRPGLTWLSAADSTAQLSHLAELAVPTPTREHLGALALQRVAWARTQQQADADYARRLLADFGPPGTRLSPRLEQWWQLDTAELFAALEEDLHNGVPTELQAFYSQRHTDALAARQGLDAQIAELEDMIDAQVVAIEAW